MKTDAGQSLLEIAITVPLLLLLLVGVVDIGRIYYYTIALSTGASEGAAYAATLSVPDAAAITQRVCDASGFAALGSPCDGLDLLESSVGTGGADAHVVVAYDLDLLFGHILAAIPNTVRLRATATFPGLAP